MRVVHELLWPPLGLGALALARFSPLDQLGYHCPFHLITGLPCVGCGGTRALIALTHGELDAALALNPLAVLLAVFFLLFVAYAIGALWLGRRWRPQPTRAQAAALRVSAIAALAANWAYLLVTRAAG
jgi:hypothetical protein